MEEPNEFISKSERKRQSTALQDVGAELVKLSHEQLAHVELPDELREAVLECKRFNKHEAIRRQLQYIGKIMRGMDPAPIVEQLAALKAPSRRQTALFHVAEKWRDELLSDPAALARFEREFPRADLAPVRKLLGAARTTRQARDVFHAVNAIVQQAAK